MFDEKTKEPLWSVILGSVSFCVVMPVAAVLKTLQRLDNIAGPPLEKFVEWIRRSR